MSLLPQTYLLGLVTLLSLVSIIVGRQVLRVRRDESRLIQLEKASIDSSSQAVDLYELGSVQLRKRMYPQAANTLKKALKRLKDEPQEARALIENAIGFALAAQKDYTKASTHYETALNIKPDYPVALNNLAYVNEKLFQDNKALNLYKKTLKLDPENATAQKRINKLKRRL